MRYFPEYWAAIASIAALALLTLLSSLAASILKIRDRLGSGSSPPPDCENVANPIWRAQIDSTELMGIFVAATVAAILAGAGPYWVNFFTFMFLLSRIAHAIVQLGGIGPENYSLRLYIADWLICAMLASLAIAAVFAKAG